MGCPVLLGSVLVGLACGCQAEPVAARWEVRFSDALLEARAVRIEARILRGGCTGSEVLYSEALRSGGAESSPSPPPLLGPGSYGFEGRASDAECVWFAAGCEAVALPVGEGAVVTVTLVEADRGPLCSEDLCVDGACEDLDAGTPDAGADGPDASANGADITSVAAGGSHTCAVRGGVLWCWGANASGQLGLGAAGPSETRPVQVGSSLDWLGVSAGSEHTCGVRAGGSLWCWGSNGNGQLGVGDTEERHEPTLVEAEAVSEWSRVSSTGYLTCALTRTLDLLCWGRGLGGSADVPSPARIPPAASWFQVALGAQHVCGVRGDGSTWCWGDNSRGQLGVGDTGPRDAPVRLPEESGPFASLSAAGLHTCGLGAAETVSCWGDNRQGQVGVVGEDLYSSPQMVALGAGVLALTVSAGGSHTCAVANDGGELYCWGDNTWGQLGVGSAGGTRATPELVRNGVTDVAAGELHTCATADGGGLACWGRNSDGQLGLGDVDLRVRPDSVTFP